VHAVLRGRSLMDEKMGVKKSDEAKIMHRDSE
jgi:hypothetical protein